MPDNEELDLNSLLGFEDDAGKATSTEQREVVSDSDAGMSLDDLFAMDDDTSLMDVINVNEENDVPPPPPVTEQGQPKETEPAADFLPLDEEGADNEEPQDLNLDLPEESDLFAAEESDSDNISLTMDTEQEEFQLPVISELQEHKEERAEPQLNLTSIFGDDEDESIDITSSPNPTVTRDELPPIPMPAPMPMPEKSEDTSFVLPQAVPPVKPLTQSAHSRNDDLISTNDDIDLLFGGPAAPTNNHHGRQSSLEVDFDDDYIGHHDNPRRSRRGIVGLIVTSVVLIALVAGGFALYSSHRFPAITDDGNATAAPSSDAPSTPSSEPTTSSSPDQGQSSAPAKSALTDKSFVTATKSLGTKTASSVPSSANAINRAIAEVDKNATDESMSKLINEIVAATKAKAPAEATSNKGSQILSVKASKTSKGLVFVVTSTGEMDLSMTVNVDGQVFQFPVQSSTGVATFVYDETIPSSGGYSYVVTSGSQEISAVRSY